MANKKLWLGILGMVLVFGMTVVGCDGSTGGSGNDNPNGNGNSFVGTWTGFDEDGDKMVVVVTSSSWTATWPDLTDFGPYTGTYSVNGNTVTFKIGENVVGTGTVSGNNVTGSINGLGFTLTRNNGSTNDNPFVGTWTQDGSGGSVKVEATENTWTAKYNNTLYNSGIYTYSGIPLVEWIVTDKGISDETVGGTGNAAIVNGKMIVSSFSDTNMNGTYSK
jgi:hypothetical protein